MGRVGLAFLYVVFVQAGNQAGSGLIMLGLAVFVSYFSFGCVYEAVTLSLAALLYQWYICYSYGITSFFVGLLMIFIFKWIE